MRAHLTLAITLLLLNTANAQWPTSPDAPLVVCNDASDQQDLRLVPDGMDGWYVVWRDNRLANGRYAVYGQRLDAQGNLLWEPNGRLIQEVPGRSINMIGVSRMSDNKLFMAYISGADAFGADTVRAMAYDSEGAAAWAEPTLLAYPGPLPGGGISGANYFPRVVPVLHGVFVGWGANPMGAADYVHIARILNDGTNAMPEQGVEVASLNNSIFTGPWTMRHDMAGGLLFEERWGNGAGAPLYAMRVDSMGVEKWPALLHVSANSSGLGYEWSSAIAPDARMTSVWGYGYDLRMAQYDTVGVLFNPNNAIDVAVQADVQENPFVLHADGKTFVTWADTRSTFGGQRQVFMQRFDAAGQPELAANGIPAWLTQHGWNGFPRMLPSDAGSLIHTMVTNGSTAGITYGFRAMRTDTDGSALWSDTVRFCDASLSPDFGSGWGVSTDNDGGAVAVWFNWNNNAIYAARLDRNGRLGDFTSVAEVPGPRTVAAHPNPAVDRVRFALPAGERLLRVELIDVTGRRSMFRPENGAIAIDGLASGLYTAVLHTGSGLLSSRIVKQ